MRGTRRAPLSIPGRDSPRETSETSRVSSKGSSQERHQPSNTTSLHGSVRVEHHGTPELCPVWTMHHGPGDVGAPVHQPLLPPTTTRAGLEPAMCVLLLCAGQPCRGEKSGTVQKVALHGLEWVTARGDSPDRGCLVMGSRVHQLWGCSDGGH